MEENNIVSGKRLVFGYLGIFIMIIGAIIFSPMILYIFYPEEAESTWLGFFLSGTFTITVGFILSLLIFKKETARLQNHEDIVLVLLTWIAIIIFGALPYLFLEDFHMNFFKCLFESTSGFSTTGFSVINDYNAIPNVYFFYRSLTLFVGGIGLFLILNSAISDKFNMRLYVAEGHVDKLIPNIVKSARLILTIYVIYVVFGTNILFGIGQIGDTKISYFEAFNYTISALTCGGFGMNQNSIGQYNSVGVETIIEILMVLGCTNVLVNYNLIRGKFKNVYHNVETKIMIFYLIILVPLAGIILNYANSSSIGDSLLSINSSETWRASTFMFISSFTTAGLSNFSIISGLTSLTYLGFPFLLLIIIVSNIGGGTNSLSGGIKMLRMAYITKGSYFFFADNLANKHEVRTHYIEKNGKKIMFSYSDFISSVVYLVVYLALILLGTFIFTLYGYPIFESFYDASASLSNTGMSIGLIGTNSKNGVLMTSAILMLLGRLEIYSLFYSLILLANKFKREGSKI